MIYSCCFFSFDIFFLFKKGEVTCLRASSLSLLHNALKKDVDPIHQAGLFPSATQLYQIKIFIEKLIRLKV